MGKGKRIKVDADEAVEFSQAELITLLQSTDKKLQTLLSTNDIRFDERLKVVLGFVDRSDPLKIRTLFNEDNKIPVQNELIETDLMDLRRNCVNGAVNAGHQMVRLEPAANSIVLIHFVGQIQRDTTNRNITAQIMTAGASLVGTLYTGVKADGSGLTWNGGLATGTSIFSAKSPFILTDVFELYMICASVDVAEDSDFFIQYSFIGDAPTITETGPAGATWSDIT